MAELWPRSLLWLSDLVLLFTIAFYWLTERDRIESLLLRMLPLRLRDRVESIFNETEYALGAYVRGQGVMIASVGVLSLAGMAVLGVPYAVLLALIAGLMEAIPIVGPVLGMVPAILVTAIAAPDKTLWVLLLFVVIQQMESNLLVPKVMEHQVGLRPLLVILALAAGNLLAGITGALVAIPIAAALQISARKLIVEPTVLANASPTIAGAVLVGEAQEGDTAMPPQLPPEVALPGSSGAAR